MTPKEKDPFVKALLFRQEEDGSFGHLKFFLVRYDPTIGSYESFQSWEDSPYPYLQIDAQYNRRDKDPYHYSDQYIPKSWEDCYRAYGWKIQYAPAAGVCFDGYKLQLMATLLTGIQKKLDKATANYGAPRIYGDYVLRIGKALKINHVIRCTGTDHNIIEVRELTDVLWIVGDALRTSFQIRAEKEELDSTKFKLLYPLIA